MTDSAQKLAAFFSELRPTVRQLLRPDSGSDERPASNLLILTALDAAVADLLSYGDPLAKTLRFARKDAERLHAICDELSQACARYAVVRDFTQANVAAARGLPPIMRNIAAHYEARKNAAQKAFTAKSAPVLDKYDKFVAAVHGRNAAKLVDLYAEEGDIPGLKADAGNLSDFETAKKKRELAAAIDWTKTDPIGFPEIFGTPAFLGRWMIDSAPDENEIGRNRQLARAIDKLADDLDSALSADPGPAADAREAEQRPLPPAALADGKVVRLVPGRGSVLGL